MRCSAAIDNTSALFTDILVSLTIKAGTTPTANSRIVVYSYGTTDGTTYTAGATGTDAAFSNTNNEKANLVPVGAITIGTATTGVVYEGGPWSLAAAFGGSLPEKCGIVVDNETGAALDSTEGNHVKTYQGVYGQYT